MNKTEIEVKIAEYKAEEKMLGQLYYEIQNKWREAKEAMKSFDKTLVYDVIEEA